MLMLGLKMHSPEKYWICPPRLNSRPDVEGHVVPLISKAEEASSTPLDAGAQAVKLALYRIEAKRLRYVKDNIFANACSK